ncbi:unnamed protein product [Nezara viridula]|uniref:Cadherin domain-containing protein n=1 Tax=Nezara viridula TaxID=85310 RepID=A0A9P0HEC2_NEZVI|nr:unnamed protein product [Nezara viridula]
MEHSDISQETIPSELPIKGDPYTEIKLDLVFPKGNPIFVLSEKKLQLLEPLDRDMDNLSHIVFQVTCTVRDTNKKRTIPVIVRVSDANDNSPVFQNTPYEVSVSELPGLRNGRQRTTVPPLAPPPPLTSCVAYCLGSVCNMMDAN